MTSGLANVEKSPPDRIELEGVMRDYQPMLLRYAARMLNSESAAQDVVQEVFIKYYVKQPFRKTLEKPIKAWLFRTAHNVAVDYIRKESRHLKLCQRRFVEALHEPQAEEDAMARRHELVLHHLYLLKPNEREVVVLRLQQGMSYREIAAVINRSEGYVGTLLHKAIKKLSQYLRQKTEVTS